MRPGQTHAPGNPPGNSRRDPETSFDRASASGRGSRASHAIFPHLLRKAPPLNRDQLIMLEEDTLGDPEPAMKIFNYDPIAFRSGIEAYLARPATR